jgi:hypothetical protein
MVTNVNYRDLLNSFLNATGSQVSKEDASAFVCDSCGGRCFSADFFEGLTNLNKIDFTTDGSHKILNGIFNGLVNLESLTLNAISGGKVINIPQNVFRGLSRLKTLKLTNHGLDLNQIHARTFFGLKSLVSLDLSGNQNAFDSAKIAEVRKYCDCNVNIVQ